MKKIILFLYAVFCIVVLQAQIVITNNDIAGLGALIIQGVDEDPSPSIVPGPAGANQTWDFSGLVPDEVDSMKFMNPDWTPYAALFPTANFAMHTIHDNMYMMGHRDADAFTMVGMVGDFGTDTLIVMRIDPPQVVADFPVEYMNTRTDVATYEMKIPGPVTPADSIMMRMTIVSDVIIDSYGSLTIPMGTFDVLRVYEVRTQTDSVFSLIFGQWTFIDESTTVTDIYTWWSNDEKAGMFLAEMQVDVGGSGAVTQVLYLKQSPTYGVEDQPLLSSTIAYPNPTTSYIIIKTDRDFQGTIEVLDILGNIHRTVNNAEPGNHRIELGKMHSGLYIYRLSDTKTGGILTGRFIIQ